MIDFLFKFYFVYFKNIGKAGAEASNRILMIPLSLNLYVIILYGSSKIFDVAEAGRIVFALGLVLTGVLVTHLLEKWYVKNLRYEKIVIKHSAFYIIAGIGYFIFSCLLFSIVAFLVLSKTI